jgi:protein-S-isoprenylcysteine O-methyltransferase Ste14
VKNSPARSAIPPNASNAVIITMTEQRLPHTFVARGGVWVMAQSILMLAVIGLGVMFPGDWTRIPVILVGAVFFIVGGYFGIAGVLVLGKNRTPYPQPRADSALVQHGIYARVRHPLYTSVMLASLGWALLWQSVSAFIAALTLIPFFYAKAHQGGALVGPNLFRLRGLCPARTAFFSPAPEVSEFNL